MEGDGDNIKWANSLTGRNKPWLLKERTQAGGNVCVAAFDGREGELPKGWLWLGGSDQDYDWRCSVHPHA